mgnify:FL=1
MKITKHKMVNNEKVVGVKLELEDVGVYVDTYQTTLDLVEHKLGNLFWEFEEDVKVSWNNLLGCYCADDINIENNSIEVTDANVLNKFINGEILGNIIMSGFELSEENKSVVSEKIISVIKRSTKYKKLVFVYRVGNDDDCDISINVHFYSKDSMIKFLQTFYSGNKYIKIKEYCSGFQDVAYEDIDSVLGTTNSQDLASIQDFGCELNSDIDRVNYGYLYTNYSIQN